MISRRRAVRRLRRRSKPIFQGIFVLSVLLLLAAAWLAIDLLRARADLNQARVGFSTVQDRLERGDLDGARQQLKTAAAASRRAAKIIDGPPFVLYSHVPLLSPGVKEVRALAHAVDVVGGTVLPTLLSSDLRVPAWNGRIDPTPFEQAQQPLAKAEAKLLEVAGHLGQTDHAGIPQISRAREQFEAALVRVTGTVHEARVAADVVPALSGFDRPRRYFLALQNNAESRATGGLIGAFAILRIDQGKLSLEKVAQNDELVDPAASVLDLGDEYARRYGRFEATRTWRSANLSPDVPTAGRLISALWRQQSGQVVDGVVFMDPVALGQLLGATGAVRLSDGTSIDASNAASILESQVYQRYPKANQSQRYAFLAETAQRAFDALSSRPLDGRSVVRQFAAAVATGHLQLWAADPDVQLDLRRSRVSGALRASGPFLSVVTNDAGGSKLDYYLHRTVTYDAASTGVAVDLGVGPQLEEQAVVSVRLDNQAPAGLPAYVTARPDDPHSPPGQSHTWLSVYAGARATLIGATLDGEKVEVESQTEQGLSVFSLFVTIDRGSSQTLRLTIRQPASPDEPLVYRQQPLIRDDDLQVHRKGAPVPLAYVYSRRMA